MIALALRQAAQVPPDGGGTSPTIARNGNLKGLTVQSPGDANIRPEDRPAPSHASQLIDAIDWALAENDRADSTYFGQVAGNLPDTTVSPLDNIQITPEPGVLVLLGAGLGGLAFLRRRRA